MTLDSIIQALATRIAQLIATRWTGKITVQIEMNRGGISKTRIGIDEPLV